MIKSSEPSQTSAPYSGLITLESLQAAAEVVRLNSDPYWFRVSIVSADLLQLVMDNGGVDSKGTWSRHPAYCCDVIVS